MSSTRSDTTNSVETLLDSGRRYHRRGDLDKAIEVYRQVLSQSPEHPDALYLSGLVLYRQQQTERAITLIEAATVVDPQHALAHASLAQIYQDQARHKRALMYFRRAAELSPKNPNVLNGLGLALYQSGKNQQAFEAFSAAILLKPQMLEAHNNLGNLLRAMGRYDTAERQYLRCLDIRADSALTHNNLGVLFQTQQRTELALSHFRFALKLDPEYAEAHNNLGAVLLEQRDLEEALVQFETASKLQPGLSQAQLNAGMALQNLGLHARAAEKLDKLLALDPDNLTAAWVRCITELKVVYSSSNELDRARRAYTARLQALTERPSVSGKFSVSAGVSMQAYLLPYQGQNDLELQTMSGNYLGRQAQIEQIDQMQQLNQVRHLAHERGGVRLGIVSAFFYDHSNWKIPIQGWLNGLSAELDVYAYHTGTREDAATQEARSRVKTLYSGLSVQQFARQILKDDIDVLIYPEVGMHPLTTRLALQRLAPVQCASWGHPVSTGLPDMDYFISSELMEPDGAQSGYREKLIRLPGLSFCWTRPTYDERKTFDRSDFGLSGNGPVYLCVQNLSKYLPQHDYLLVEIARQLPSVQLVFIEGTDSATAVLKKRLKRHFDAAGLDFEKLLVFLPRQDKDRYHALNQLADVFLDTPDWSGCNSSLEALVCDLPVVTLPGRFMRGRHTLAFYRQMDYQALVARDEGHYIELALRLGRDDVWRAAQRKRISQCRHRLEGDMTPVKALAALIPALIVPRANQKIS